MARPALTGVLLVGGASRRFGSPKALAILGGETLAARAWRSLGEACEERIAVGKAGDGLRLPFPVLADGEPTRAALAGVVAGLRAARHEVCVVLPVDCPLASPALLRALGEACADAACTEAGPLPGAFARSTLPLLKRSLAAGRLSLRDALAELETAVVPWDARELVNVNRRAELDAVAAALAAKTPAAGPGFA